MSCSREMKWGIREAIFEMWALALKASWSVQWLKIKACLEQANNCIDGLVNVDTEINTTGDIFKDIKRAVKKIRKRALDACEDGADYFDIQNCLVGAIECLQDLVATAAAGGGDPECQWPPCDDPTKGCTPVCRRKKN